MAEQSQITGALGGAAQGAATGFQVGGVYGAVIGGVIGGAVGFFSGGGEDEAKEIAEQNAKYILDTQKENERRATLEHERIMGTARAAVYASNLQPTGGSMDYITAMGAEFRREMRWDRRRAHIEAKMALKGGQVVANRIERAGFTSMVRGIGDAAATFGGPYNTTETPGSDWAVNTTRGSGEASRIA